MLLNWKFPPNVLRTLNPDATSSSAYALPSRRANVFWSFSSWALATGFGTGSVVGDCLIQLPVESRGAWNGANCIAASIPLALLPSEPFSCAGAFREARVRFRLLPTRKRLRTSLSRLSRMPKRWKSEPISIPSCLV